MNPSHRGRMSVHMYVIEQTTECGVPNDGCLGTVATHWNSSDRHRLCEEAPLWRRGEDTQGRFMQTQI